MYNTVINMKWKYLAIFKDGATKVGWKIFRLEHYIYLRRKTNKSKHMKLFL